MQSYNEEIEHVYLDDLSVQEIAGHSTEILDAISESVDMLQNLILQHARCVAGALDAAREDTLQNPDKPVLGIEVKLLKSGFSAEWYWHPDPSASPAPGRPKKLLFSKLPRHGFRYHKNDFSVIPSPERELLIAAEAEYSRLRRQYQMTTELCRLLARCRHMVRSEICL